MPTTGAILAMMDPAKDLDLQRKKKKEEKRLSKLEKFKKKTANTEFQAFTNKKSDKNMAKLGITGDLVIDHVLPGHKKDVLGNFPDKYNPVQVESSWYEWWSNNGLFMPEIQAEENKHKGSFCIVLPPPNVTGSLHIGHALTCAVQDSNRMKGKATLFIPGCDHAGIATQSVVERNMLRLEGKTRFDYGRDEFIKKIFEWKERYGNLIYKQISSLGVSTDWTRERFTMDENLCHAVTKAFVTLYDRDLIYRSNKLVNWCPLLRTAISNLEVISNEIKGGTKLAVPTKDTKKLYEFGLLYTFSYKVKDSDNQINVSTTRLETMLGDVAIAVHPEDERYKEHVGKTAIHPLVNREILIVADCSVDMNFGTGAVKITPAHDHNDFELANRHNLPHINILTDDGYINENACEPFIGLFRMDAREAVKQKLVELGCYVKTEMHDMVIPMCSRSGDIIEPLIKPQWWTRCQDLANKSRDLESTGKLKIMPKYATGDWHRWLGDIQDWCISRQIWWGHRVPAYFINIKGEHHESHDGEYWVSGVTYDDALEKAKKKFPNTEFTIEQDNDVLDTWFSSALWPSSTLGWPNETQDMKNFYPNSLLETGWDILFFWVARMVMLGVALTGKSPFKEIFCHAIVRDAHNRKMSKSLGNVIDPLDVINGITLKELNDKLRTGNLPDSELKLAIEFQKKDFPNGIPTCGADSLRFTLLSYVSDSRSINLDVLRVEGYRKWGNKLWNAAKFVHKYTSVMDKIPDICDINIDKLSPADKWVLHKLNKCASEVNKGFKFYEFMSITNAIHQFWMTVLCDFYIEMIKPILFCKTPSVNQSVETTKTVLLYTMNQALKLLHPFMPYITEELYQRINRISSSDPKCSIMIQPYPEEQESLRILDSPNFELLVDDIKSIRSFLKNNTYKSIKDDDSKSEFIRNCSEYVKTLVKASSDVSVGTIHTSEKHKFEDYSVINTQTKSSVLLYYEEN